MAAWSAWGEDQESELVMQVLESAGEDAGGGDPGGQLPEAAQEQ